MSDAASGISRAPNASDGFPQFAKLPLELQSRIWWHCLPHQHVVELDLPMVDSCDLFDEMCSLGPTSLINQRPSIVTKICRESRRTALLAGSGPVRRGTEGEGDTPAWYVGKAIENPWRATAGDVLHSHWSGYGDEYYDSPMRLSLALAKRYGMRLSVPVDIVSPGGQLCSHAPLPHSNKGPLDLLLDASEEAQGLGGGPPSTYMLVLRETSLHVSRVAALASGLFGVLGEEPVKLVPAADDAAIQRYYALYQREFRHDEPSRESFEGGSSHMGIAGPDWRENVPVWVKNILSQCVRRALKRTPDSRPGEPASKPPLDEILEAFVDKAGTKKHALADMEHPWVAELVRARLPRFVPVVMFRLCGENCFKRPVTPHPHSGMVDKNGPRPG